MTRLAYPFPLFVDSSGALLHAGEIYIGEPGTNPETPANRVDLFWDADLTVPAAQPLTTIGGYIVNEETPSNVFLAEEDYSILVKDANAHQVSYAASAEESGGGGPLYQPVDSDLTAIAALTTTSFGRSLLELANAAALKAAAGVTDFVGGTVTANIVRSGAGAHVYFSNAAYTGARIVGVNPTGTADATSQPGDMQFFY